LKKSLLTGSFLSMATLYVLGLIGVPRLLFPIPALDVFRLHAGVPIMPAMYTLGILPVIHGALLMLVVAQWFSRGGTRTLLNETVNKTAIRLSLMFLGNGAWYLLWDRDWHLYGSLLHLAHAIVVSSCARDVHKLVGTVLPPIRERGVSATGRKWLSRVVKEWTTWDVALTKGPISMYAAFSFWVAALESILFLESRFPVTMDLFQNPISVTVLLFLCVAQSYALLSAGDLFSFAVSLWMSIGIIVQASFRKAMPVLITSAVGLNFMLVLGLIMMGTGIGFQNSEFFGRMFGAKGLGMKKGQDRPAARFPTDTQRPLDTSRELSEIHAQ